MSIDVVSLTQQLIRCPSITPQEAGALTLLETVLTSLNFTCYRMVFEGVENLYARRGILSPHLCFLGHTDVVPPGDLDAWTYSPFEAIIDDGILYGRGAVDMKGAIAAFIAAISQLPSHLKGSLSLLITADEEGPAVQGTCRVVDWLKERGEIIDFCLGGEPTSESIIGDTLKIGRRGSLNGILTVYGTQGHVAYPLHFNNPIPLILKTLNSLYSYSFDQGSEYFPSTCFEVTSVDVGNLTSNLIPAQAQARFNVRFNNHYSTVTLQEKIQSICSTFLDRFDLSYLSVSESFLTSSLSFARLIQKTIEFNQNIRTTLSTSGGTSDARFMHNLCPIAELGLTHKTAHKIDEQVPLQDLDCLTNIYLKILKTVFS